MSAVVAILDVGPVGKLEVSAVVVIPDVGLVSKLVVSAVVVIRGVVAVVKPVVFCFVVISEIKIVEFLYVMAVNKTLFPLLMIELHISSSFQNSCLN